MKSKFINFVNDICKSDKILAECIIQAYNAITESTIYPERLDDENDSLYAKRIKTVLSVPTDLPEDYARYFIMNDAEIIPIDQLVSPKIGRSGDSASILMRAAYDGKLSRRSPISVKDQGDGTYLILDGNGTYNGAKNYGWRAIPAIVME